AANTLPVKDGTKPPRVDTSSKPPAGWDDEHTLLATVVLVTIRLAREDDSLRRAEACNDLADHLVQAIVLSSARGEGDRARRLGKVLGEVFERGVVVNLARVQQKPMDDSRLTELANVQQRAQGAGEPIERKLK